MNTLKVGFVQINNSFADACYFPYSVGILQAYFQKHSAHADRFEFLPPIYRRVAVDAALHHLEGADVVGFSVYSWNFRLSLEIARSYKKIHPEALIVFGGPHVPCRAEPFLREHSFIDLACHGEGEIPFRMILEACRERRWDDIPSISYLEGGRFVTHPEAPRTSDLSLLPSPYLEGVFDPLMASGVNHQWLGLWETNRGCPFSCAYCDWGAATKSKLFNFDMPRLEREVEWFATHGVEFVFCCDSNFGILKRDMEIVETVSRAKERYGYPKALSVQNTKSSDRSYEIQKALARSGLSKGVNLALQSMSAETLRHIGRQNISAETFQELQRRFARDGIETFTDIILALPGETYRSFVQGVARIIKNGQHNRIQFINLSILPNAPMADPKYRQAYGLETVETKIINIHGAPGDEAGDDIAETQELVVSTASMPPEEWRKARIFSWMASLLHFDKLLQIPMVLLHESTGVGYDELIEAFLSLDDGTTPILSGIGSFFAEEAEQIQRGGAEFHHSRKWLDTFWPHDEFAFILLATEGKLEEFYREAEEVFRRVLLKKGHEPPPWLHDALVLNRSLLKQPFQSTDCTVSVGYNLVEAYRAVLSGETVQLRNGTAAYEISRSRDAWKTWEDWCREVVWYCNKRGAYLYDVKRTG